MKGSFFQKPLGFQLNIEGESWHQGDSVSGVLAVKNHGTAICDSGKVRVCLAHGSFNKVKAQDASSFKLIEEVSLPGSKLNPDQTSTPATWKFSIDRNGPITDKAGSLYVLYGNATELFQLGQIQINILPHPLFLEFVQLFELSHRFVVKHKKAKTDSVEVKLAPPKGQEYVTVDQLLVRFRLEGDRLVVNYMFDVKQIGATASSTKITKKKKTFEHTFTPGEYLAFNQRLKRDDVSKAIDSVLADVRTNTFV